MKFYNRVKDEIQDDAPEEDGGGNVAFDELKKNADKNDVEDEEPDDTEIEDLTGSGTNKEYGDPSKIELNEDTRSQAGRAAASGGDEGQSEQSRQQSQDSQDDSSSSSGRSGQRQQEEDDEDGSEVALTPDGHVREPGEEPEEDGDDHPSDETQKEILEDMREQNEHIINLLRGIKRSLDRP